ncbi:hypothetical protein HJC23_000303 [Cyclotella cryptica]|uniref:Uncharacterized protein n=1 Tax=Cyclotella cryptica TaxID=29204 RepID=A0ABD3P1R3_9STRA
MVFVAKKPHLYIPELQQQTTELVNIGLYFGSTVSEEQASSWLALARAIRQTTRSIRCLWLRFADGDESVLSMLRSFGQELVGCTAVQSLILENKVGMAELLCLKDYLTSNTSMRGIKFLRTSLDTAAFILLRDFFAGNGSLKVLDVYANNGVGDEAVREVLGAISEGRSRLETLNVGESNFGDDVEGVSRVTHSGVEAILAFVRRSKFLNLPFTVRTYVDVFVSLMHHLLSLPRNSLARSIAHLKIRLRGLTNARVIKLANILQSPNCNISRLELCGSFGDEGVEFLAEALKTNRTVKTISIGVTENLSDRGGRQILRACQDIDGTGSWSSVTRSNHTLRSVFISEKHAPRMSSGLICKLQSLTSEDPRRTLQNKAWNFIQRDVDCLPNLNLKTKHMPYFLKFVATNGGHDCLFQVLRAGYFPDLFTHPTPEKIRLKQHMKKIEYENQTLRTSLEREMRKNQSLRSFERELQNDRASNQSCRRDREEQERFKHWYEKRDLKHCCLQPFIKAFEVGKMMIELLKEIYRI